MEMYQHLA
jgi:hypothetical protein